MHRTLERQLKRLLGIDPASWPEIAVRLTALGKGEGTGNEFPEPLLRSLPTLLERVDDTYMQNERDLALIRRSLELSSAELTESNQKLRDEAESSARALEALRGAFDILLRDKNGTPNKAQGGLAYMAEQVAALTEERERMRAALVKSEERFELAMRGANDGLWDYDVVKGTVYYSPRWKEMIGYGVDEIGQELKEWSNRVHPLDLEQAQQAVRHTLEGTGTQFEITFRFRHKKGHYLWILGRALVVRDETGRALRMVGTHADITARKHAEAELIKAKEAAEEANRMKSEFLATMSHEIRTPMNGVLGMNELLLETRLDNTQRHYAQSVMRSGQHLLGIINDILDFSKIESGRIEFEKADFNLGELVEDAVAMFESLAADKGLELAVQLSPPHIPLAVSGDSFRLRQVLANLVSNAIKFTAKGEVIVRVQLHPVLEQQVRVSLSVEDTGIGIAPKSLEKIFENFTQADGSTTRQFGGTGLGLAISKRLVELMGGTIGVESTPGQGSKFWIHLDMARSQQPIPSRNNLNDLKDVRALVVDDNRTNREILYLQLSGWQMRASCVESAEHALEELKRAASAGDPVRLAILDMHMPHMDGLQLARAIKAIPELAGTRLIMLTSANETASAIECNEAGILSCVNKPVRQAELHKMICAALARPYAHTLQAQAQTPPETEIAPDAVMTGRILLAEDNPVNQQVAVAMLGSLGLKPDIANNGAEALAMLERQNYDVVLMDCQMPLMDGYQATARIRARESGPGRLPVIALTANAMDSDRIQCMAAGMDDFLAKPYSMLQLENVLKHWLVQGTAPSANDSRRAVETPDAIEAKQLDRLRELDPSGSLGLAKRIIRVYLDSSDKGISRIEQAIEQGDGEALRSVAHSLKSSSANVGAATLSGLFRQLEELGKNARLDEARPVYASMWQEYCRATNALQALLEEGT
jgi:PAS domain S-box-containing protein